MYEFRDPYTIDFSNVKYYGEIHTIIKEALDFPDYYGRNWDAFWDCLTDMVGRKVAIEIIGMDRIRDMYPDIAVKMLGILKGFKHYEDDEFVHEITIRLIDGNSEFEIG